MIEANRKGNIENNIHENISIGVNLSLIGGFLDAYSFILMGGVFANAQTGNLVLLFITCVNGEIEKILKYSIPIIMFALGILLSEVLKYYWQNKNNSRVKFVLLFETIIIICIAITGKYVSISIINCIISFLAAVQVSNFDKINGVPIATTMITGNLRSSMININKYFFTKDNSYKDLFLTYLIVIISFGIGVSLGSIFAKFIGTYSILICITFLFTAYLCIIKEETKKLTTAST